jgi:hypothetical protein
MFLAFGTKVLWKTVFPFGIGGGGLILYEQNFSTIYVKVKDKIVPVLK